MSLPLFRNYLHKAYHHMYDALFHPKWKATIIDEMKTIKKIGT